MVMVVVGSGLDKNFGIVDQSMAGLYSPLLKI